MITIFTTPSCSSCRKAKLWLDSHDIKYVEKNLNTPALTIEDVKQMFQNSKDGYSEILSKRSKIYKDLKSTGIDFDELRVSQLLELILKYPSILKRPIILDGLKMKIGFHEDEISIFIPIDLRNQILDAKKGDSIIHAYAPKKYQIGFCDECDDDEAEDDSDLEDAE
ncbi:MAG: transcriptional regulator Spx [Acholeplasmatales bacterium]|jgi:regulatory protein spx|nr:transcriptional regulator Spx [Acholeplasmatales bacterium]